MKFRLQLVIIWVFTASLGCESGTSIEGLYNYSGKKSSSDLFPGFSLISEEDSFFSKTISTTFSQLKEPSLSVEYTGEPILRLSIQHKIPIIITFKSDGITVKKGNDNKVYRTRVSQEFNNTLAQYKKLQFASLPVIYKCNNSNSTQTKFLLESHLKEGYKCTYSTSCNDPDSYFHSFCQSIIEEAHLENEIFITRF